MYPKAFILMAVMLSSAVLGATVPLNGDFDIDHVPGDITGISFDPIPWNDPSSSWQVEIFPYATLNYVEWYSGGGYDSNGEKHDLGRAVVKDGLCTYDDIGPASGDMAFRIMNWTDTTVTSMDTVVTLNLNGDDFEVYLPEFTFGSTQNMHFWIGSDGSSYFANSSHGAGAPDMSAAESIDGGHVAMIPEPATMILLAAGSIVLIRKRKA